MKPSTADHPAPITMSFSAPPPLSPAAAAVYEAVEDVFTEQWEKRPISKEALLLSLAAAALRATATLPDVKPMPIGPDGLEGLNDAQAWIRLAVKRTQVAAQRSIQYTADELESNGATTTPQTHTPMTTTETNPSQKQITQAERQLESDIESVSGAIAVVKALHSTIDKRVTQQAATAIRAAIEAVVPEVGQPSVDDYPCPIETHLHGQWSKAMEVRDRLLAIADELEGT